VSAPRVPREEIARLVESLHDETTAYFERLDGGARFREDRWDRPGGGGGVSRVISDGGVFEKGGINRSTVEGELSAGLAARIGGRAGAATRFWVTGMSLVLHPRSPMVPTVHLNVRCFELTDDDGAPLDRWFGGGSDLTPYFPFEDDAAHFHRVLRERCGRYASGLYPRFKRWCDDYFVNAHRGGERRGVGGIFYDHLRAGEEHGLADAALVELMRAVGASLPDAYGPIVARRRETPYGDAERRFQLLRRGRYVEFNLVHDRGTLFGLQTDARIESVLMSLPPLAAWEYAPTFAPGSFEARLVEMLEPRDWAGDETSAR
jgi:coproporphyrinogen III oxidase